MITVLWIVAAVIAGWTLLGLLVGALLGTVLRRARSESALRELLSAPAPAPVYARSSAPRR